MSSIKGYPSERPIVKFITRDKYMRAFEHNKWEAKEKVNLTLSSMYRCRLGVHPVFGEAEGVRVQGYDYVVLVGPDLKNMYVRAIADELTCPGNFSKSYHWDVFHAERLLHWLLTGESLYWRELDSWKVGIHRHGGYFPNTDPEAPSRLLMDGESVTFKKLGPWTKLTDPSLLATRLAKVKSDDVIQFTKEKGLKTDEQIEAMRHLEDFILRGRIKKSFGNTMVNLAQDGFIKKEDMRSLMETITQDEEESTNFRHLIYGLAATFGAKPTVYEGAREWARIRAKEGKGNENASLDSKIIFR